MADAGQAARPAADEPLNQLDRAVRLATIRRALDGAAQVCRFHGANFGRAGWWRGEPRCDSCKQPWRISEAYAAVANVESALLHLSQASVRAAHVGQPDADPFVVQAVWDMEGPEGVADWIRDMGRRDGGAAGDDTAPAPTLVARCENYRDDLDAPCTGRIWFRWGQIQAACDTCGGYCGVAVAAWERIERAAAPRAGADTAPEPAWPNNLDLPCTGCGEPVDCTTPHQVIVRQWEQHDPPGEIQTVGYSTVVGAWHPGCAPQRGEASRVAAWDEDAVPAAPSVPRAPVEALLAALDEVWPSGTTAAHFADEIAAVRRHLDGDT